MPLRQGSSAETFSTNVGEMIKAGHPRAHALAAAYRVQRRALGGVVPGYDAGGTVGDPVNQVISALQQGVAGNGMGASMGAPAPMNGMPQPAPQPAGVAPAPQQTMGPQPPQTLAPVPGAPAVTPMNSGVPQNAPTGGVATPPNNPMMRPMMASGGMANMGKSAHLPGLGAKVKDMHVGPVLSAVPGRTDKHNIHVPSSSYVIPADLVSGRGEGNTLAGMNFWQKAFHMGPYGSSGSGAMHHGPGAPHAPKMMHAGGADYGKKVGVPTPVIVAGGEIIIPPENLMKGLHSWLGYRPKNIDHAHELMDGLMLSERKKLRKTLAKLPGPAKD